MKARSEEPRADAERFGAWLFSDGWRLGLLLYLFFWLLLALFRVLFIAGMTEYLTPDVVGADIFSALWQGMKLSMKTAGLLTIMVWLPTFLLTPLSHRIGTLWWCMASGALLFLLSLLFVARFPYYRQFHSGYHQLLFNTLNDDVYALFVSLVQEFYLPVRLSAAILLAYGLYRLLAIFLAARFLRDTGQGADAGVWPKRVLLWGIAALVWRLAWFGGALGWETEVGWENAGVTKEPLLNEAILDDGQAIFRAWTLKERWAAGAGLFFSPEEIRRLAGRLTGKPAASMDLDFYLTREAQGAQIPKPRHIFLLIGESYANWPLLPEYAALPIADGMKALLKRPDSAYCGAFLPNGDSTVSAVTGIVAGLADANLYLTTMPEAFAAPYPTASAPVMERLGYATYFWYAGPASWERIGDFVTAQGYDHFRSRGDISASSGNVWGVEDEDLYAAVLAGISAEEAQFHVLLNVSNHSPFSVDLAAKGFDQEAVRRALPEARRGDEDLLRQLGHFWYEDRAMAKFIAAAQARFPDSLFLIIGDHADRYNVSRTPGKYERYAIPFIVAGPGVTPRLFPPDAAGSQIDVVPTLVEMIAPEGFSYESIGQSLSRGNRQGVNYLLWVTKDAIGLADTRPLEGEPLHGKGATPDVDEAALSDYIDAVRAISWWRAKYGASLEETR